jgi:hypothetical protein
MNMKHSKIEFQEFQQVTLVKFDSIRKMSKIDTHLFSETYLYTCTDSASGCQLPELLSAVVSSRL